MNMYKGLLQQPTFIYTECSDVTEVFNNKHQFAEKNNSTEKNETRQQKTRFNLSPESESVSTDTSKTTLRFISSPTSIIKRSRPGKTSTIPRANITTGGRQDVSHFSHQSDESTRSKSPVCPQLPALKENTHDDVLDSKKLIDMSIITPKKFIGLDDSLPIDDLTRSLEVSVPHTENGSDSEFVEFAKDFARHCRHKRTANLLNPGQYNVYLQKAASKDRLHGRDFICNSLPSSSLHSTSHGNSNLDDKAELEGHVVGDLITFVSNTAVYFDNPDLSDVILMVDEHRFYAHKLALAAQSEVFRDMLIVSDRCSGCPDFEKELKLNESKECQQVFPSFLRFFYCGKISFSSESALPLLVLAAKYRVESLRVACDAFITGMIEDGDLKSAVKWLRYAARYELHDLTAKCVDGAISDNIEELADSPDWLNFTVDCMEAILRSSSLLVPDEFFIFEALQRWFMSSKKTTPNCHLEEDLRKTLQYIRFSQMHSTQLLAVEESPIGLNYRSIIRTYLGDAYRYQILAKESPEFQEPQYLPRDYTDKQCCVQMFYHPNRNKRTAPSAFYGNGKWEIQPRRYYDTLNVVIILKKPLEMDVKVYISILIYKRCGSIQMRLRRKACVLRALEAAPRVTALAGGVTTQTSTPTNTPRSNSTTSSASNTVGKDSSNIPYAASHAHRSPHGPASKLHGPHDGQEYYAIDNIISDSDFQTATSQSGPAGIKLGVIIRTCGVNLA
nr:uncharacterized protein LOC100181028 isoform X1 [Ciona intestinalis]|eukprot:XP_018671778.1 uncharacterized protein LOC100181028 isoform X1 [Ciona intestinalis]